MVSWKAKKRVALEAPKSSLGFKTFVMEELSMIKNHCNKNVLMKYVKNLPINYKLVYLCFVLN